LSSVTLDNATSSALSETYTFNNRLQMVSGKLASSSTTFMNHTLAFADSNGKNNGNVQSITDQMNSARNQTFGYDQLNRLSSAVETAWGLSFGYDSYGNLLQQNVTLGTAGSLNLSVNTNNQITGTGFSYDAAGHLTADGTNAYTYDGAGGLSSVNNGAATYTYDPSELRVRKDVGGTYTEYVRVLGHVIAERDSTGNWTDYIFMGDRRIARAADYDTSVAIHGTNSTSGEWTLLYLNNAAGLSGYTIRSGDKLYFTQWQQPGSRGGMVFGFTDGSDSNRSVTDQDGYFLNDDQTQGTTHFRSVDLSSFAGKTVHDLAFVSESDTSVGTWEIDYEQAALVSTDGTVSPIYTGESSISIGTIKSSDGGVTGRNYTVDTNTGNGTLPQQTTIYYHSDHIDSARLITTGYGYPVWQGTYLPFGYEYNPEITTNHYKFTGYEHDSESGLENAEARMLSSQLARFTGPDQISADVSDPQSQNRYSYVRNEPTTYVDPTGEFRWLPRASQSTCDAWFYYSGLDASMGMLVGMYYPYAPELMAPWYAASYSYMISWGLFC
jgi:RHS repeat-associated protein